MGSGRVARTIRSIGERVRALPIVSRVTWQDTCNLAIVMPYEKRSDNPSTNGNNPEVTMAKQYVYTVKAIGFGSFPDDMLRYDAATVVSKNEDGSVTLTGKYPPAVERWRSFGWDLKRERNNGSIDQR